ncbi:hypothetical protein XF35_41455 [Streptomyces platensis subsp. clarensis]|nr:hypothetical protein [Streptomyces platensis subsp. clarensis]
MADPEADTLELPPVPDWGRGRPRWAAQRIHPRRIGIGHRKLISQFRDWTRAEGHPAAGRAKGARLGGLALAALTTWRPLVEDPRLLALAGGSYLVAAWRASRPTPVTEEELQRRFLLGVQELIGDRPGIHVRELYDRLQAQPAAAHLDDTRLRALLVRCGVPTQQMRHGDVGGRIGIKAADVAALLSPAPVDTSSGPVDAGQHLPEEVVDQPETGCRPPSAHSQKEPFMPDHDITVRGHITLPDGSAVACPDCGTDKELTVYGPDGGAGHLMCPSGHHFPPPAPIDPYRLLASAVADPRTEFLS